MYPPPHMTYMHGTNLGLLLRQSSVLALVKEKMVKKKGLKLIGCSAVPAVPSMGRILLPLPRSFVSGPEVPGVRGVPFACCPAF